MGSDLQLGSVFGAYHGFVPFHPLLRWESPSGSELNSSKVSGETGGLWVSPEVAKFRSDGEKKPELSPFA